MINVQDLGEFWLIDLGSSNGTFLNKRRVHHPMRLNADDHIVIGDDTFVFRQPIKITNEYQTTLAQQTMREIKNVPCWLLVADIEDFTPLSLSLVGDKLAVLIGGWVSTCKEIIEEHEGTIDKYLGDGFFAYWREDQNSVKKRRGHARSTEKSSGAKRTTFSARLAFRDGCDRRNAIHGRGKSDGQRRELRFPNGKARRFAGYSAADQCGGQGQTR